MTMFAQVALLSCLPLTLLIFAVMTPRRALIASTIFAWLFMPNISFALPGLPDYSKTTATTMGAFLAILIFDRDRIFRFRLRWFDAPILVFCLGNFFTSLSNDLGVYDGLSGSFRTMVTWFLPYFLGRVYLSDLAGLRDCAMGIVIGGLVYAPLCLYEIRMSPQLQWTFYGIMPMIESRNGLGYRPVVFMVTGLEVGMWMVAATLIGFWLWRTKAWTELWGVSAGTLTSVLAVTSVLIKSVGALVLLAVGLILVEAIRRTKLTALVWVILLTPPTYMFLRASGLWSGQNLVELTAAYMPERRSSIATRIDAENLLTVRAMERPVLGWGGFNRSRVFENGRDLAVTDGFWIIVLGNAGVVGVGSLTVMFLLPLYRLRRLFPAPLWLSPQLAPAVSMAILLGLYMVDNLSNAMFNPMYALAIGGVLGLEAGAVQFTRRDALGRLGHADALREAGHAEAAEALYLEALALYPAALAEPDGGLAAAEEMAYGFEALAGLRLAAWPDRSDQAELCLWHALELREGLAAAAPADPGAAERVASGFENLGRFLYAHGRPAEAADAWSRSLEARGRLAAAAPDAPEYLDRWADAHNDLAWFLASHPGVADDAAAESVRHALRSVELRPGHGPYLNTLGAAAYASGDFEAAVAALGRSVELAGGTGFDDFLMAKAYARLGDHDAALACFARADDWARAHHPDHPELARLRDEAAALISA